MSERLPAGVVRILERGRLCHVAARTRRWPHLTPMVFVLSQDRLWLTTSRGSVKSRAWGRDPRVGGMVSAGGAAVAFGGRVQTYDALDPRTWERGIRRSPALTVASARFSRKNARFFAGYAVDARHVPLAWTPPGRVFVEIEIERAAILDERGVGQTWGEWEPSVAGLDAFRARKTGPDALRILPAEIREALRGSGFGALAVDGDAGLVCLPVRWAIEGPELYAAAPEAALGLAGWGSPQARVALVIDRASWWRARHMTGVMVQGAAELFATDRLRSGGKSADARVALTGAVVDGAALVRIRPERLVWWRGWSSGSVMVT